MLPIRSMDVCYVLKSRLKQRIMLHFIMQRQRVKGCLPVVQVVDHLSEEQQIHRDLLTIQRDDRAREIDALRHEIQTQQQQLIKYGQTIVQLRTIVNDLLRRHNNAAVHSSTTAQPVFPIGMFVKKRTRYADYERMVEVRTYPVSIVSRGRGRARLLGTGRMNGDQL